MPFAIVCYYPKRLNQKLINPDIGPDHNKYEYDTLTHGTHYGRPQGRTTFFTSSGKNIVTHLSGKQLNNFDRELIYPSNHRINYPSLSEPETGQLRKVFHGMEKIYIDNILIEPSNLGTSSAQFGPSIHDEFPDKQVYSIDVKGADTDTILRVDNKKNRPKTDRTRNS